MRRWFRKIVYLVALLLWMSLISLPFFAVLVASRGEVHLRNARVFLVQERDLQGVGIDWQRPLPPSLNLSPSSTCTKTNVTYLMWEGQAENTAYCSCDDSGIISCPP
ncbi:MAG: hypothetical protein H6662_10030 [Ardenticatenaceae bacterium]|nr:hypothetical protein [Anaerolineales bacterium]MCB8921913.1 hypothetical protein [Ardenticatenaceae bacterium]MCB8989488.1 hypothetical protein [Ardenticatenaceae bacterium]